MASFDDIGALPSGDEEVITDYPIQTSTATVSSPPPPPVTEATEITEEAETGPEVLWLLGFAVLFAFIVWVMFTRRRQTI